MLPLALSLVTIPVYLGLVGQDRFGVLSISWLLLGYFGLFDLGLGRATSYQIAAQKDASAEARATTFWSAMAVNSALGLIGGLVLFLASDIFFSSFFKVGDALRPEIVAGLPFLALSVPVATITGVLTGALQGREKFLESNSISVTSTALFQLLPLSIAWLHGPYLPYLLIAALAARVIAVVLLWVKCHQALTRGIPARIERSVVRGLLHYGGWVSVTAIFGPMLVIADRFAIGAMLGAAAVTVYSLPFQLAQRIAVLPSAMTNAMFPRLASASAEEVRVLSTKALATLSALITLPVFCGVVLIGPFFDLWVGPQLGVQAAPVGRILLIGFWANAFALIPFSRLQASGRPDLVAKLLLVQIPPYLIALYFAMQSFGLMGCAAVFTLRCIVDYVILSFAAENRVAAGKLITGNLVLLGLAAFAGNVFGGLSDPRWWAAALILGALCLFGVLRTLPRDIFQKLCKKVPAFSVLNRFVT